MSVLPRFVLNLSPPSTLDTLSFVDVLSREDVAPLAGHKIAFVGADVSNAVSGASSSATTHQVLTSYDTANGDATVVGTPLHVFWAMIAQMYVDKAMVSIPPGWAIVAITVAFCALIVSVMGLFGGPATLGMILVYIASGPYVNALAIRSLQVYLPLFDSYYFGLSTFIVAGLGRLSTTAFHRWRLDARRRFHAHMADLKGNFVSLLSHNLNTPVAKMQGMLALLAAKPGTPWHSATSEVEALVTQLEYSIRSVLVASALEEGVLNETPRALAGLAEEFSTSYGSSLKRLGLKVAMAPVTADDDDEALLLPLLFDIRAVTTAIGALAALFYAPGRLATLAVELKLATPDGNPRLDVLLSSRDAWIDEHAAVVLTAAAPRQVRTLGQNSFFAEILAGLANLTVRIYQGTVSLRPDPSGGGAILATFVPEGRPHVAAGEPSA